MERVFIINILSEDLKSRSSVNVLYDYVTKNSLADYVVDFSGVNFATRSFMDEFYNVFVKDENVKVENMPDDILYMLEVVKATQHKEKPKIKQTNIESFSTIGDLCSYMSVVTL